MAVYKKVCASITSMRYVDLKPTRLLQPIYFSGGFRKNMAKSYHVNLNLTSHW